MFGRFLFYKLRLNPEIKNIRDISYLAFIILFVVQPLSAIIGNTLLFSGQFDIHIFVPMVIFWWFGNSIGQLVMVPFVLFVLTHKYNIKSLLTLDMPVALGALLVTYLLFRLTNNLDNSFVFVTLMFLLPVTLLISTQKNPETVVLALLFMTIAAFFAISAEMSPLPQYNLVETYMRLDLLIISLQLSGLLLSVLIADLRNAHNMLAKNQQRLDAIINTTLVGFTILNQKGIHVYANKNAMSIHGYAANEILGAHFGKVVHPDYMHQTEEMIANIISGKEAFMDIELKLLHKTTNQDVWIHVVATKYPKVEDIDDESILAVFHDITQLKHQEQALRELNATKDKFVSIIAHDLKNSFNALIGFSDFLKSDLGKGRTDRLDEFANAIFDTSVNTYSLLENLLKWAKVQQGKISFDPQSLPAIHFVNQCIFVIKNLARAKNIELTYNCSEGIFVMADVDMLHTILRNLATNAIKFTHKNGKIEIHVAQHEQTVEFKVIDNGIGISPNTIENLFRIDYSSSEKGTEGERGTGLGLILCKEFVEKHAGKISVESILGKGSTFIVSIPAAQMLE